MKSGAVVPLTGIVVALGAVTAPLPEAGADALGYLVNITVRPGYNFPNPEAAVAYGYAICDRVGQGASYSDTVAMAKDEIGRLGGGREDYQAAYLISQAVDQLCPQLIWQLRNSAANYTGGPP
jgi:hypothetical protein